MIYEEPKVDVIEFAEGEMVRTLNLSEGGTGGSGANGAKANGGWLFGDE